MKTILKQARKASKMRSRELANLLGVDQSLISKFENGSRIPTEKQVQELSAALTIDYKTLMKAWLKTKIYNELKAYAFADEVISEVHESNMFHRVQRVFEDMEIDSILSKIDDLKQHLDSIRKFDSHRITEALELEYTFESNRIEGNTLTLRETDMVVNQGLTVSGKTMKEHLEAINHVDALQYMKEMVARGSVLTKRELLTLHNLILRGINTDEAGRYRNVQVMIKGSTHVPPAHYLLESKMEEYFRWYEANRMHTHPVVLAAEMHEKLVTIHPFIDGNGRTSRLVMNLILLQSGYVIANIKGDNTSRYEYYEALEKVQVSNDKEAFIRFIAKVELKSLERYLSILQ